tara:strand:- start:366 stop:497 length:132 start_codon:yes stop_codon:yes gene_type:complete
LNERGLDRTNIPNIYNPEDIPKGSAQLGIRFNILSEEKSKTIL